MGSIMKIVQIAPLMEAVPPKPYGGRERLVSYLTEALLAMGYDVMLFASGDGIAHAKSEVLWPQAAQRDPAAMREPIASLAVASGWSRRATSPGTRHPA